jgi:MFS family permease
MSTKDLSQAAAWKFIILVGLVSLFSDLVYEGARSISGPFLGTLGASAAVVGVVAGLGEFIGYALRLASGYLADRTEKYWALTLIGYFINLAAVPLLALAGNWQVAALLLLLERLGKAIRTPARDAMLSHAATEVGRGWGFGFHRAMDQIGAVLGPLMMAGVLYVKASYRLGFAALLGPAILALLVLMAAARLFPHPQHLEVSRPQLEPRGFRRPYWLFVVAAGLLGAGYADFPLIAFHFHRVGLVPASWIPIFYAVAMGMDALAALICGRLFDRLGLSVLIAASILSALFAPLVFLGGPSWALVGMMLWGLGLGAQGSIMKAALADLIPKEQRGTGYGIFHAGFGLFWFLGSALMGILYEFSLAALITFSVVMQLGALPLFVLISRQMGLGRR